MHKFDDELLSDFINGFWGYGSNSAQFWFVGMEEGGGNTFEELQIRFTEWNERGRKPLEDLFEYHENINISKWFVPNAPIQPTWNKLIRVLLSFKGIVPTRELVRSYQIEQLGRKKGETCLLELLPLPSPSTNQWLYDKHSEISTLLNREQYMQVVGTQRVSQLKRLIVANEPKFVVFYGFGYLEWWKKISNTQLIEAEIDSKTAYFGKLNNTSIAITQHPVAMGIKLDYFHEVGEILRTI